MYAAAAAAAAAGLGTDPHVMKEGQQSGAMRTRQSTELPDKESTGLCNSATCLPLLLLAQLYCLLLLMDIGLTLAREMCISLTCYAATFNAAA